METFFIETLASDVYGKALNVDLDRLSQAQIKYTLQELISYCSALTILHYDYSTLAARLSVYQLHQSTASSFSKAVRLQAAQSCSRLSPQFVDVVYKYKAIFDSYIDYSRDYKLSLLGIETMKNSYLLKNKDGVIMERPQDAYMRVAIMIYGMGKVVNIKMILLTYDLLSRHIITHASPTMFNAGTKKPQLSSCFLLNVNDNLENLYDMVKTAGIISGGGGGIGLCLSGIRAKNSFISGSGLRSNGIQNYIMLQNASQCYANQGGLRPGAYAVYLELWHQDIFTFLEMPRLKGQMAEQRLNAPNLKYGLWVPDLFMEILEDQIHNRGDGRWYLFSPDQAPNLHKVFDLERSQHENAHREFKKLYYQYVAEKRYTGVTTAKEIIKAWFKTVIQVGNPYIGFKDAINRKSNLSHVGTITNSNLCIEVTIPCWEGDKAEQGVCNLAAVNLAAFIRENGYDYRGLIEASGNVTENLDNIIDNGYYPTEATRRSNMRHRPIGIGVFGLADVFASLKIKFGSPEAIAMDEAIHAALYYGAMRRSIELAKEKGSHPSFPGSAASKGLLQPDLWVRCGDLIPSWEERVAQTTQGVLTRKSWRQLRLAAIQGVRNGYLTALMPTATSSNSTGKNECFEPFTSNLYTRRTLSGEFIVLNKYLIDDLKEINLWTEAIQLQLLNAGGSIQHILDIPAEIRDRYKTSREMNQKILTKHAAARNPFVSQSMSLNYYFYEPELSQVLTVLVLGWKKGLTTGSYYCHFSPGAGTQKKIIRNSEKACNADCEACLL
ncbi:pF778R [African swine fever virus]|uniref:Ribonucleoside-diphosphate reductase large subunit n=2 Tax=African swine fever virus TaxID=10497 RepID=RIR1_ASFP4|nr:RecName: Full=Ribonucleoside-diphosphate reductase large subunit; AltName: Full=Ribonucleotide reductase large subunit [African swine fever virus tick/South Africa/Pretoriuskop Pr4/1996]QST86965.1 pF778R [African swine fever virus]